MDAGKALPPLPRVGLQLGLPEGFEQFKWYGRGPHENYVDRKASADIGIHHVHHLCGRFLIGHL